MVEAQQSNTFYAKMGMLLLALLVAGFGSAAFIQGRSLMELPVIFHMHGAVFIAWYLLFINQARLIGGGNHALHKKLGYSSVAIVTLMIVTGFMVSSHSFDRGLSPIPDTTIQQFMAFPMMDLVGILIFYTLGVAKRGDALFHKHCMLIMSIAIMDPGIARLAISFGFPPLAILVHIGLVIMVMMYDRRTAGKIHMITWAGLAYVILRVVFIFTAGASEPWANLMNRMFA